MKDITQKSLSECIYTDNIANMAELIKMKKATPARIGIGHAGARYKTEAMLRFSADQAAAADAVFSEVDRDVIEDLGVFEVHTKCKNKYEMLTRPDWGRVFEKEAQDLLLKQCVHNPDVQIYFGDGLCSPAIKANVPDLLPTIQLGLADKNIRVGTPFFVRYCRVNTARTIGPLLNAKVVCVLIGERPGLITSESMSAYIAYRPRPDMSESEYTVVSNISRHGIPPVEAAAHIVDVIAEILEKGKSGVALKM
ncbi:MAG: ethanolamine ammonia-lyase subunit EutC [Oscillospiraceae bacterium]